MLSDPDLVLTCLLGGLLDTTFLVDISLFLGAKANEFKLINRLINDIEAGGMIQYCVVAVNLTQWENIDVEEKQFQRSYR